MTTKILDIGSGGGSLAAVIFDAIEDKAITRVDINPDLQPAIVHDIREPLPEELRGQFDLVLVSHVMEHVDRRHVTAAFRNSISAVRNMGEVWFITPSMEWAANEILNHNDGELIQAVIFGSQENPYNLHQCGFTLAALRTMVEICGLIVRKAYQSPCTIDVGGKEHNCIQNIVIGARYDGINDPADAIAIPQMEGAPA